MNHKSVILIVTPLLLVFFSCRKDKPISSFKTKNVIVVVMDGPRYSETWGDSTHQYIPRMANDLLPQGIVSTQFYNNGPTYTTAGHTAITTGNYQEINNAGLEIPAAPSIFQYWLKKYNVDTSAAWVIASKSKLAILADCQDSNWSGTFNASTNCGVNGLGSAVRDDSSTFEIAKSILTMYHPNLVLINFREPDFSGHQNNWTNYTQGIKDVDEYIYQVWNYIETDPIYKGTTTLFVTNDHGRHLDTVSTGFSGHGDSCDGCRHINFFACGPDFKKNVMFDTPRELIDIPTTIAWLMDFNFPSGQGNVMHELFSEN